MLPLNQFRSDSPLYFMCFRLRFLGSPRRSFTIFFFTTIHLSLLSSNVPKDFLTPFHLGNGSPPVSKYPHNDGVRRHDSGPLSRPNDTANQHDDLSSLAQRALVGKPNPLAIELFNAWQLLEVVAQQTAHKLLTTVASADRHGTVACALLSPGLGAEFCGLVRLSSPNRHQVLANCGPADLSLCCEQDVLVWASSDPHYSTSDCQITNRKERYIVLSRRPLKIEPLFTTIDIGIRSDASVEHVIKVFLNVGEAIASRWMEMPRGVLLLHMVPGDAASGALYLYDREGPVLYLVD